MTGQSLQKKSIVNSPYAYPGRHWQLDENGIPTDVIIDRRRDSAFISPVPKPRSSARKSAAKQAELVLDEDEGLSDEDQQYTTSKLINELCARCSGARSVQAPAAD